MRKYLLGISVLTVFLVLAGCGERDASEVSDKVTKPDMHELIARAAEGDHR